MKTVDHNYVYIILLHVTCFGSVNIHYKAVKNTQKYKCLAICYITRNKQDRFGSTPSSLIVSVLSIVPCVDRKYLLNTEVMS